MIYFRGGTPSHSGEMYAVQNNKSAGNHHSIVDQGRLMLRNSHHMKTISKRLSVRKIKPNTQTQQLSSTSENPMRKTQTPGSVYDAAVNDLPRPAPLRPFFCFFLGASPRGEMAP